MKDGNNKRAIKDGEEKEGREEKGMEKERNTVLYDNNKKTIKDEEEEEGRDGGEGNGER